MHPNPIADTVRAASPLPNVRCLRTAAKLAGMFLADTDDSLLMAFSAACTFFNAGETQIAALSALLLSGIPGGSIPFGFHFLSSCS